MSIEERVRKIVCEQLGVADDKVKNDSSFVDDLGADSLDIFFFKQKTAYEIET